MIDAIFSNKKIQAVLAGLGIIVVIILTILSFRPTNSSIDDYPLEGTDQDYSAHARIVGGDELFSILGGDRRFDALSRDLFYFAETAYSVYRSSETEVVGFKVTKQGEKVNNSIEIEGEYGSIKNKVRIKVDILANDRIKTSITDTKTDLNIDSKLPSNNKLNQYIATLPENYDGYTTEYDRSADGVTIFLDDKNPALADKAFADITAQIDDGSYDRSRFNVLFPAGSIGE